MPCGSPGDAGPGDMVRACFSEHVGPPVPGILVQEEAGPCVDADAELRVPTACAGGAVTTSQRGPFQEETAQSFSVGSPGGGSLSCCSEKGPWVPMPRAEWELAVGTRAPGTRCSLVFPEFTSFAMLAWAG